MGSFMPTLMPVAGHVMVQMIIYGKKAILLVTAIVTCSLSARSVVNLQTMSSAEWSYSVRLTAVDGTVVYEDGRFENHD
jgi:hypothetical protein